MKRIHIHIVLAAGLIFITSGSLGQSIPYVKAGVDRNQIVIGEPIKWKLEIQVQPGTNPSFPPIDTIPHFDILDKGKTDSNFLTDLVTYTQILTITSFDSGSRMIPPVHFNIDGKTYTTDSIPVEVGFSKFDPRQDYHDIKDIFDVGNPNTKFIIWFLVPLALVSVWLVYYFIRKSKMRDKAKEIEISLTLSAFDQAMAAMKELKTQRLAETGQVKLYYTKLNDILRLFVLRKLHMASLEKTNEELIIQLKDLNISRDQFYQLSSSLRMSDFVKFARYLPEADDNDKNFTVIESSIQLLNEIEK